MANDLVRVQSEVEEEDSEWDLPPTAPNPTRKQRGNAVTESVQDVKDAKARGDDAFAAQREADLQENSQSRWDWGDLRTWLILFGMFFGFLLVVAIAYWLPTGQHASPPTIRIY